MEDRQWSPLAGDIEAETCVIGGGLAGIATALALVAKGRSVVVLESERMGWGASGRNGGFASPGYPVGMPALAAQVGEHEARALWRLSVEALALVRRRAEALGPSALQGIGALRTRIAGYPDTLRDHVAAMNERFGAGLVYLPQAELRAMVATECYVDGYLNPSSLQVHPLNLLRGMAQEAAAKGAVLHEGSRVGRLVKIGARHRARTSAGSVTAQHIVLAGGAHLGLLHARLGLATVPVASYVMSTEPDPERVNAAITTHAAVSDTRVATDYYRKLPDGRLLWGGRASALQSNAADIGRLLHADMTRIFPQLDTLRVATAWSGLMPIARHRMPIIGPLETGIWAAACFGGLGLATTTLAGELIGGAIAEGDDRYKHFAPFRPMFAGGSLGRAAFQMIYWRHQLGDRAKRSKHRGRAFSAEAA